jgi:branched-chain amino acid transport system ATP-binding protein
MILKVESITKNFGGLTAIYNLSFDVVKGEIFGIAGPNGAGKSTLFNLISGFLPYSGKIYFQDNDISKYKPYQICQKGIARTFQLPLIFSTMTLKENIYVGALFNNGNPEQVEEDVNKLLAFFKLSNIADDNADKLNTYYKKLVMIASALSTKPLMLMLDEPLAGLNPKEINETVAFIKAINKDFGVTIIIIEHLMKELVPMADRLMFLNFGEKICIGKPESIITDDRVIEAYLGGQKYA